MAIFLKKRLFFASKSAILLKNRYFLNFAEKNKGKIRKEDREEKKSPVGLFLQGLLVNVDFDDPAVLVNRKLIASLVGNQPLDYKFEFFLADLAVVVFQNDPDGDWAFGINYGSVA